MVSNKVRKIPWRNYQGKILEEGEAGIVERLQHGDIRWNSLLEIERGWARKITFQMIGILHHHEERIRQEYIASLAIGGEIHSTR